ncbi:hypothetical protein VCV18_005551 [Metarhizium anisopliae]
MLMQARDRLHYPGPPSPTAPTARLQCSHSGHRSSSGGHKGSEAVAKAEGRGRIAGHGTSSTTAAADQQTAHNQSVAVEIDALGANASRLVAELYLIPS